MRKAPEATSLVTTLDFNREIKLLDDRSRQEDFSTIIAIKKIGSNPDVRFKLQKDTAGTLLISRCDPKGVALENEDKVPQPQNGMISACHLNDHIFYLNGPILTNPSSALNTLKKQNLYTNQNIAIVLALAQLHITELYNQSPIIKIMENPKLLQTVLALHELKSAITNKTATQPAEQKFKDITGQLNIVEKGMLLKFLNCPLLQTNPIFSQQFGIVAQLQLNGTYNRGNTPQCYNGLFDEHLQTINNLKITPNSASTESIFEQLQHRITKINERSSDKPNAIEQKKIAAIEQISRVFNEASEGRATLQDCLDKIDQLEPTIKQHSEGSDSIAAKFYMFRKNLFQDTKYESTSHELLTQLKAEVQAAIKQGSTVQPVQPTAPTV